MTDAERLVAGYHNAVSEAASRIAPEKAWKLEHDVFEGKGCDLLFKEGDANFFANLETGHIEARFAALLSLWATAHACLDLAAEVGKARTEGKTRLALAASAVARRAYTLLESAKALIKDHAYAWPADLPLPDINAGSGTEPERINNLFLGSTAWALLHEVAHLKLGHQVMSNTERENQEEFEADDWAAEWVLEGTPTAPEQEFRVFCVATALLWLQLVEDVRGTDHIHPPAFERLARCANRFPHNDDSPALEMAADVLKVVFDPKSEISAKHTADAFASVAIRLTRRLRS